MIEQFSASHFRRFEKLELSGFNRVNLITGPNGVGKTSVLEGLFICCGAYNPELALRINAFRGVETIRIEVGGTTGAMVRSLFRDMDAAEPAVLKTRDDSGTNVKVQISVPAEDKRRTASRPAPGSSTDTELAPTVQALRFRTTVGPKKPVVSTLTVSKSGIEGNTAAPARVKAVFLHSRSGGASRELAARLGKVSVAKHEDRLVEALQIIEPNLTAVAAIPEDDETVLYADIGRSELVPLWLLGGGMSHLAHIILAIMEEPGRVVLIDEIENGLYYDTLSAMWRAIAHAARESDCQVFATTHSRECVAAAHEVFAESFDYDLSVHRLEASDGIVNAVAYDRETLEASIEAGFEVR